MALPWDRKGVSVINAQTWAFGSLPSHFFSKPRLRRPEEASSLGRPQGGGVVVAEGWTRLEKPAGQLPTRCQAGELGLNPLQARPTLARPTPPASTLASAAGGRQETGGAACTPHLYAPALAAFLTPRCRAPRQGQLGLYLHTQGRIFSPKKKKG